MGGPRMSYWIATITSEGSRASSPRTDAERYALDAAVVELRPDSRTDDGRVVVDQAWHEMGLRLGSHFYAADSWTIYHSAEDDNKPSFVLDRPFSPRAELAVVPAPTRGARYGELAYFPGAGVVLIVGASDDSASPDACWVQDVTDDVRPVPAWRVGDVER